MGWLFPISFAAIATALLWRFAQLPRGAVEVIVAAALVGIAGYAWQGNPALPGSPADNAPQATAAEDTAAIATRQAMSGRFGGASQVVDFADTLERLGLTQAAVTAVRTAIDRNPKSVDLWVALGNALVAHGRGLVSPAAEYAFARAAQLSPTHPAPPFFLGLARANAGQSAQAAVLWRGLLARTPADAPWRKDIEARLALLTG